MRAYTVGDDSTGTPVHHSLQCAFAIIHTSTDHNLLGNAKSMEFEQDPYCRSIIIDSASSTDQNPEANTRRIVAHKRQHRLLWWWSHRILSPQIKRLARL